MGDPKLTVGQAIDQIAGALRPLDSHQQKTVVLAICALLKIEPTPAAPRVDASERNPTSTSEAQQPEPKSFKKSEIKLGGDIVALKQEMQPSSAREMACLIAY
jgi:hypothetical protein